ncbi:MAG TPA: DUF1858 domain-containing protein [Salinarimonas sp.]|nr:DUF1858 domain-containing protein [Salinarimonas sp.]
MRVRPTDLEDDVMQCRPAAIRVFLDHRFRCVGCPIACFHTVEDACREHGADERRSPADLEGAALLDARPCRGGLA